MLFNGLTIGAVAGHLTGIGYHQLVVRHRPWCVRADGHHLRRRGRAAARCSTVGAGLPNSRASTAPAAKHGIQLVCGATAFLLIAAFVEAYWSSMTLTTPTIKYIVGAALWLLVGTYFMFAGRGRYAAD